MLGFLVMISGCLIINLTVHFTMGYILDWVYDFFLGE